ncbi:MAG TPA: Stp1/IreP family PP2C-type Ser/Thr phosphatase [Candidatus Hydrogenedens sp.]|nr:Stp1/IreP family PP2C-type Ser/Thr phosphatase [Candidatus Hydrogenedens sp.]HOL19137.1 Stp1/IreP family PP2C-type Ser/Thr phosphatase [Candidatus Hydrogenedens sp.]HPP58779.1 Stp1/IreP family PP2C-type Ser/Thr phosphatase [Candidatus Hydrogenedens sp.]
MKLDIAGVSDKGRKKDKNEDFFGIFRSESTDIKLFEDGALLIVADGLGGHIAGDVASKLAVSLIKDILKEEPWQENTEEEVRDLRDEGPLPLLREAFQKANESIYKTNKDLVKGSRPMGTTAIAAIVIPGKIYIANVGDSRAYHIRNGEILEFTEDHSWVDEQIKQGLMSRSEAEKDTRKHIVTRCIGTHPDIEVDVYRWHPVSGDILLLCTDGLINMVPDNKICEEIRKGGTAGEIAQRLVNLANENGGKDNITVIVTIIEPKPFQQFFFKVRLFWRKHGSKILKTLFLIAYGAISAIVGYYLHDVIH